MTESAEGRLAGAGVRPTAARLFGEAMEAWTQDQKTFWTVAGGIAALVAALQFAIDAGWLQGNGSWSTAVTGYVYAFVLDHFLKVRLFPDWSTRGKAMARARIKGTQMSWRFFGFCAAYGFAASLATLMLVGTVLGTSESARAHGESIMLLAMIAQPPILAVLALLFAPYLLYLPSQSAGTVMTLAQSSDAGRKVRGTLAVFALLCVVLAVVSYGATIGFALLRLPPSPWVGALLRGVVCLIDVFVLYALAHGLASLFRRQTGWTPPPIPVAAS